MGWWNDDILGGDSPLDSLDELQDLLGISYLCGNNARNLYPLDRWSESFRKRVGRELRANHVAVIRFLMKRAVDSFDGPVIAQVLGVVYMAAGIPMPEDIRIAVLNGCAEDVWMKEAGEDSERGRHIHAFAKQVRAYDGSRPIIPNSKGLFD